MTTERTPDAGDEMNRELYLAPSLIGDSEDSPLLDQAADNVAEQAIDNLETDRARTGPGREASPTHEAGGIVFAEGPDPKGGEKPG